MTKQEVAASLDEIAILLELKGENLFRCKAYINAARTVEQLDGDLRQMVAEGKLSTVRGIGDSMAEKIGALVLRDDLPYLNDLRKQVPAGLMEMLKIPGLGPKKVKALYDTLKITTIAELRTACDRNDVAAMKGFGEKTQDKILAGIEFASGSGGRVRFDLAYPLGLALLAHLEKLPGVRRAALCGSLRRCRETSKDIDILISSDDPAPIMQAFVTLPEVETVIAHGETKSSIRAALWLGTDKVVLNADLRVVEDTHFPFAQLYFTGSKEHNIRLRSRAIDRGLVLNEYSLEGGGKSVPAVDESDIYRALDLIWVPPELREDSGEIELSEKKQIPELIELDDLRGVFHNHSTYSDGSASIEEMALAAKSMGWEYFGIGDHSQSLKIARGLTPAAVRKQHMEIERVNARLKGVKIIKGIECDILGDGSLDYDDETLRTFDYVVVSVHTLFNMTVEEMTARICKALSHPCTTMLGHATGRLLLQRDAYKVDLDRVIAAAAEHGKMIEINAQPLRLDLEWRYARRAKALGIPLVINPDAHSPGDLELVKYGINEARRAGLTAADVFNTRTLAEVMAELQKRKQKA